MSELGSGRPDHPCISAGFCRLQELAQSSQWGQVLETLKDMEDCRCLPVVTEKAVGEGQWECVAHTAAHCGVQQREVVVQQAAAQHQWQCVTDIVKIGVGPTVRNSLLKQAVAGQQVECAARLISLGVHRQDREDSLRQAVDDGDCDFVLGLLETCRDPDLQDFVLREGMKRNWWQLVWGLVKQGLSLGQMESVCDEAVGCRQWDLVLHLLQQGVSASEWIINELFQNNMAQSLLDSFPKGSLMDGLKGLLLMTGIRHGQGDITLQIFEREKVSDAELMEAMKYAVNLLDAKVFLKLIRHSARSRRVFKQKFHKQDWKESLCVCGPDGDGGDGGEIGWIFDTLCNDQEYDLALHVARTNTQSDLIIDCWLKFPSLFDLKKLKFRHAVRESHGECGHGYREMVLEMYQQLKAHRPFLFRQAIRLGEFSLAGRLCEVGVKRKDLKFAVPFLVVNQDTGTDDVSPMSFCWKIPSKSRTWFRHYTTKCALREYFKEKSDLLLTTFIDLFKSCSDKAFCRQLFRSAVTKAVKFDDAECFVQVCDSHLYAYAESYSVENKEDCYYAYLTAIQAGRKHVIAEACQKRTKRMIYRLKDIMTIVEIVFETKAWDMLPCLSAGIAELTRGMEEIYKPFIFCLDKMMNEGDTWTGVAPALEHWMKTVSFPYLKQFLQSVQDSTRQQRPKPFSMFSVAQWSLEQGFYNLAFVLALALDNWSLVEAVLGVEDLDIKENIICEAVALAASKGFYCVGAVMLKLCPLNSSSVGQVRPYEGRMELAKECQKLGLADWALAVSFFEAKNVTEMLQACDNQIVLDHVMEGAYHNKRWNIVQKLVTRCGKKTMLERVLKAAVADGQCEVAESIIGLVDPSVVYEDSYLAGRKTLLRLAVEGRNGLDMVRLCIASGLSTFQRKVKFQEDDEHTGDHNCPMLFALGIDNLPIIKLMLKCGAYSHRRLHRIRRYHDMQYCLRSRRVDEVWKEGYRCMLSAAATPSRLEHMARLIVSHLIGCHPGRADRIERLPVPPAIKNLVNFKDVLHVREVEEDEAMDVSESE